MQQDDLEFREQVPTAARETRDAYGWVAVAALTGTAVMSSQISLIGRFVGNCRNKRDCMYCALLDWSADSPTWILRLMDENYPHHVFALRMTFDDFVKHRYVSPLHARACAAARRLAYSRSCRGWQKPPLVAADVDKLLQGHARRVGGRRCQGWRPIERTTRA
ncbi:MAG: hypothetical protein ACPIOQ_17150 [Promethearchaeia archaeon]